MFVTDSLFSLEFAVDKLTITPGVVCRFPAVAFRFLDFPTVSLHLLDEVQRDRLRSKLSIDPEYKVPDQLKDFQNKSGYYELNSGKSCLYRIPPDDLRSLLAQVPLYVIIADEFTPSPTLVGSATLPLTEPMEEVYELLLKDGVSVPASSGVRSNLTVYNLMGHAIGQVMVGCRLISLGMALLSHLPESSVVSHEQYRAGVYMPSLEDKSAVGAQAEKLTVEAANISNALIDLENGEEVDGKYPIIYKDKQLQTQTVEVKQTQTTQLQQLERKSRRREVKTDSKADDEGIELTVPDIYCPPPLYYNKLSIAQRTVPYRQSLDFTESSSSHSIAQLVESQFGKPYPDGDSVLKSDGDETDKPPDTGQTPANLVKQLNSVTKLPSDGFPLLSALVSELLKIGAESGAESAPVPKVTSTPLKSSAVKRSREVSPISSSPSPQPKAITNRDAGKTFSSPKGRPFSASHKLPPKPATKKGPLVFGYTNTQKLRLSKTNPELLRRIEESEAIIKQKKERERMLAEGMDQGHARSTKLKIPRGRRLEGPRSFRSYTSQQQLDASTEMGRLATELTEVKRELAEQRALITPGQKFDADGERQQVNTELGLTKIITPTMSKVLPAKHSSLTPRRSISVLSNRTSRDGADLSTLHEQSFQSDSRRSLEIHLPTPALEEGEGHSRSAGTSDYSQDATSTGRDVDQPKAYIREQHGKENLSPDVGEEYSLTLSHGGVDNSSSPLGVHPYSYGSDSFVSED